MARLDWYVRANLKLRHLQLLLTLDDTRHLGRAAGALNVSQPAVSLALAEMEKGLALRLFERTPRGVVPNSYGECLIRHARVVIASLAEAHNELQALQTGASGRVTVGALPAVTPGLLPRALLLLKRESARTQVVVHEGPMEMLLPELRRDGIDMVVGRLPPSRGAGDLAHEILGRSDRLLMVNRRHPLLRRRKLRWADLSGYPWVLPPVGSLQREPLERALADNGCEWPSDTVETLSIPVVAAYLQGSQAIGVLSRDAARHSIDQGLLAALPLALPDAERPIGMMWNRHKPASPALASLQDCLRRAVLD